MKKQIGVEEKMGFEITGGYCDPTQFHAVVELSVAKLRMEFVTPSIFNLQERGYVNKKLDGDFYIFCIPEPKNHRF